MPNDADSLAASSFAIPPPSRLNESKAREVLRINHTDGTIGGVHDDEIVDAMFLENMEYFDCESAREDGNRFLSEEWRDGQLQKIRIRRKVARKIALSEYPREQSILRKRNGATRPAMRDFQQDIAHNHLRADECHLLGTAHDLLHGEQQRAPEFSTGMEPRKIIARESTRFQQRHGKRITEDKHRRGARGRGKLQRTGFTAHGRVDMNVRALREEGRRISRDGNDPHIPSRKRRKNGDQFVGLAAVAQKKNHVPITHNSQVTMERIQCV